MKIKREVGFTLIEIMLVLVLLSLSAMAVIMSLPDNQDDQLEEEASRFINLFNSLMRMLCSMGWITAFTLIKSDKNIALCN